MATGPPAGAHCGGDCREPAPPVNRSWPASGRFCHDRRRWVLGAWLLVLVIVGGASGSRAAASRPSSTCPTSSRQAGFDILERGLRRPGRRHQRHASCSRPSRASTTRRCRRAMEALFADAREPRSRRCRDPGHQPLRPRARSAASPAQGDAGRQDRLRRRRAARRHRTPRRPSRSARRSTTPSTSTSPTSTACGSSSAGRSSPSSSRPSSEVARPRLRHRHPDPRLRVGAGHGPADRRRPRSASASASALVDPAQQRRRACPTSPPFLGVMIGLGVGIDYALFIVTRYREQLHPGTRRAGRHRDRHRHRRPGGAVRRHHRRDLAARHAAHGRGVRQRPGHRRRRRRGRHHGRLAHPAAGAARLRRRAGRGHPLAGPHRRRPRRRRPWSASASTSTPLAARPARSPSSCSSLGLLRPGRSSSEVPRRAAEAASRETFAYRWSRLDPAPPVAAPPSAASSLLVVLAIPVLVAAPRLLRRGQLPRGAPPPGRPTTCWPRASAPASTARCSSSPSCPAGSRPRPALRRRITEAVGADPGRGVRLARPIPNDPSNPDAPCCGTSIPDHGAAGRGQTAELVDRLRDDVLPAGRAAPTSTCIVTGGVAVNVDFSDYLAVAAAVLLRRRARRCRSCC